ncbi:MAG: hypothetical protein ABR549_09600 [Mycobacteriales bacterium]
MSAVYKPGPGFPLWLSGAVLVPACFVVGAISGPLMQTAVAGGALALMICGSVVHDRAHQKAGEHGHALRGSNPGAEKLVLKICAGLAVVLVVAVFIGLA